MKKERKPSLRTHGVRAKMSDRKWSATIRTNGHSPPRPGGELALLVSAGRRRRGSCWSGWRASVAKVAHPPPTRTSLTHHFTLIITLAPSPFRVQLTTISFSASASLWMSVKCAKTDFERRPGKGGGVRASDRTPRPRTGSQHVRHTQLVHFHQDLHLQRSHSEPQRPGDHRPLSHYLRVGDPKQQCEHVCRSR